MKNETTFVLERAPFKTKDGREMFNYFVPCKIMGMDYAADILPKDPGGYEFLNLMFKIKPTVDLVMWQEVMTDEKGRETEYDVLEARVVNEDGLVFNYKVKLAQPSDKAYLNVLKQMQGV